MIYCVLLLPAGVGDFQVADVNFLPDPCALPDAQKKRALNEKERLLYAPMAGVGGVVYDKDAVYIDLPANHVNQQQVCAWHESVSLISSSFLYLYSLTTNLTI